MSEFAFEIVARSGAARSGVLRLERGAVLTPAFMPVGTAATVKAMLPESVAETATTDFSRPNPTSVIEGPQIIESSPGSQSTANQSI